MSHRSASKCLYGEDSCSQCTEHTHYTQMRGGACCMHTRALRPGCYSALRPPPTACPGVSGPHARGHQVWRSSQHLMLLSTWLRASGSVPGSCGGCQAGRSMPAIRALWGNESRLPKNEKKKKETNLASCAPFLTPRTGRAASGTSAPWRVATRPAPASGPCFLPAGPSSL